MRRRIAWLLKQLLPPACPLCSQTFPLDWQAPFCADCSAAIVPLPAAHCSCCGMPFAAAENSSHLCGRCTRKPPPFSKVYTAGCYEKTLRDAIQQFKFNRRINLDRPLAALLNDQLPREPLFDLIIPVPLHRSRLQQRYYNQSLLLALEIARQQDLPVVSDLLVKAVDTVPQQELSAAERERNLRKAFRVTKALDGESILLVDDVMTTGATGRACSQALLDAGAAEVQMAVVARA